MKYLFRLLGWIDDHLYAFTAFVWVIGAFWLLWFLTPLVVHAETINWGSSVTTDTYTAVGRSGNFERFAQPFTPSTPANTAVVHIEVQRGASLSDNLILEIRDDNAGAPGSTVLTSTSFAASNISFGNCSSSHPIVTPSLSATMASGTKYWVVLTRSGALDTPPNIYEACEESAGSTISKGYISGAWGNSNNSPSQAVGSVDLSLVETPPPSTSSTGSFSGVIVDKNRDFAYGVFVFLWVFGLIIWILK